MAQVISCLKELSEDEFEEIDMCLVTELLELVASKFIEKEVAKDGNELRSLYKQPNYLANLDSKSFLLNRNKLLVSFICAVAQIDLKDQDNKTFLYSLATAVEMIYFLRNQNLILPHAFLMNLVQSFILSLIINM